MAKDYTSYTITVGKRFNQIRIPCWEHVESHSLDLSGLQPGEKRAYEMKGHPGTITIGKRLDEDRY